MKLKGSAKIYIQCRECEVISPRVSIYLYQEDEGDPIEWQPRKTPEGWDTDEGAEVYESGDTVYGYCPKHKED